MRIVLNESPDGAGSGGQAIDVVDSPFESELQIEDVAEEAGPSKDDLLKEFETLKQQNKELTQKADQATSLSQSFNQFGERLEKSMARPVQVQAPMQRAEGETTEQFKERINRTYLEDPYTALVEFNNRHVGGAIQTLAEQNLKLQRQLTYLEAPDKDFIAKHQEEIEGELKNIPIDQQIRDPHTVTRAIDTIRARHMEEIVTMRVNEALAKAGVGSPAPRPALGVSEAPATPSAPSSAPSGARKVQVTPAKRDRILQRMSFEGIPQEKYTDYVGWLVEDGEFDKV